MLTLAQGHLSHSHHFLVHCATYSLPDLCKDLWIIDGNPCRCKSQIRIQFLTAVTDNIAFIFHISVMHQHLDSSSSYYYCCANNNKNANTHTAINEKKDNKSTISTVTFVRFAHAVITIWKQIPLQRKLLQHYEMMLFDLQNLMFLSTPQKHCLFSPSIPIIKA